MTISFGTVKWKLYAVHFAVYYFVGCLAYLLFILATPEEESEEESEAIQVEGGVHCSLQGEERESDTGTYKLT